MMQALIIVMEIKMIEFIVGFLVGIFFRPIVKMVMSHLDNSNDCEHKGEKK